MNKRIRIFTFMLYNYGAILQAYALQHYLRTLHKYDVQIVNFETKIQSESIRIFRKYSSNFIVNFLILCLSLWRYPQLKRKQKRVFNFKKTCLSLTKEFFSTEEEVLNNPPQADIYISGSDQVFNPNNNLYWRVYYLGFPKNNSLKIAYAPSFGISQFTSEMEKRITPYIKDFDLLSCREKEGAQFLSKITQSDVPVVIDPVFLLSSGEWEKIAVLPDQKGYIFIYDLNGGQSLVDIARQIKQKTGLKIICLTLKVQRFYPVDKQIYDCGPREFIGYIRQAEYVVTDSFHGTAFSIIFKKKFYTYVALNHMSSRIYTLLESLNLKDRIIENKKVQEFCFEDQSLPDYARKLNEIISESKTFLQKI